MTVDPITSYFEQVDQIACICPNCQAVLRLAEARPYRMIRPSPSVLDRIYRQEKLLDNAVARLEEIEHQLREVARKTGLRQAQKQLRKIGGMFTAAKFDPHDAKVICDPVQYIVFDGMTKGRLRQVVLCASEPSSKGAERVLASIEKTISAGDVEFQTVRISAEGTCSS